MDVAKLPATGQMTVPVEVRRRLHLVPSDKVLFVAKANGEVVVARAGLAALAQAQAAFAEDFPASANDSSNPERSFQQRQGRRGRPADRPRCRTTGRTRGSAPQPCVFTYTTPVTSAVTSWPNSSTYCGPNVNV